MVVDSSGLVENIVRANGGVEGWGNIQSLSMTCVVSGATLALKGHTGNHVVKATIHTKTQKVTFERLGQFYGTYTPEKTEVGTLGSQSRPDIRPSPRDHFKDHTVETIWDSQNLLYFAGYSFWYYLNLPFLLRRPGFQVEEVNNATRENGEIWRVLRVTFPEDFDTHSKVQHLYYDDEFRLRRLDYQVDIIPTGQDQGTANHYCYDHKAVEQLIIPGTRMITLDIPGMSHLGVMLIRDLEVKVNKANAEAER
ncbi:hypothetical protein NM208_g1162 [Fusarium decemcellulare]|uniref:Uncharacterized protein n=1 Tax=Fusarium decemcellulare TaxID=57161 RepID=A0ACC1SWU0_9HYPO|nr:hypothetical protein NM208_g1162 [Fusarium decemcellulare]